MPAGHPQGYLECFEAFVAETYRAIDGGATVGLPTFADGVHHAAVVAAVLHASRHREWNEVAEPSLTAH